MRGVPSLSMTRLLVVSFGKSAISPADLCPSRLDRRLPAESCLEPVLVFFGAGPASADSLALLGRFARGF